MSEKFAETLKKMRRERGFSQEELAERLGTSKQVISRYESGQRIPKISMAYQIAKVLGISLEELNGQTHTPAPTPTHAHIYEGTQIAARTSGSGEEWAQMVERLQERKNAPILPEEQEVVELYRSLSEGQKRRFKELMTMVKEWGNE